MKTPFGSFSGRVESGSTRCWAIVERFLISAGAHRRKVRGTALLIGAAAAAGLVLADEATNPFTGLGERVYSESTSKGYEVFWARELSPGTWDGPVAITDNELDDLDPVLAFNSATGSTIVLFWRDGPVPSVIRKRRDASTGTWASEAILSDPSVDSRYPSAIEVAGDIRFVFETRASSQTRSVVQGFLRVQCPGPNCPFGRWLLRTTGVTFTSSPAIHLGPNGEVWSDWQDAASPPSMGYSEFDVVTGTWGPVSFEPIETDLAATRVVIRQRILDLP